MINETKIELAGCILDKKYITSLLVITNKYFGSSSFSIEFKDGTKLSDLSIAEFEKIDFNNRTLSSIELQCYESDYKTSQKSSLYLYKGFMNEPYVLTYSSSDNDIYLKIKADLEGWINNIR